LAQQDENTDITLERALEIVRRRRWWVIVPTTVIALAAALVTFMLPKRYESEATILVEGQQVPERYVTANTTNDLREVLLLMTDAILSRTQLLRIIDEFGLYSKERSGLAPEQLAELMRSNIVIQPEQEQGPEPRGLNAFKISFIGDAPGSAQAVTGRLTELFIKENNQSQEEQSTGATKFLADKLAEALADLKEQDIRVRDFKMKYLGELPEEQQGNLAILSGLQSQLQNSVTALERTRAQEAYLQSLLSSYQDFAAAGIPVAGSTVANPIDTMRAELTRLQNERAELLARYTEKYPDVVKIDQQIKETQALLAAVSKNPVPHKDSTQEASNQAKPTTEKDSAMAQVKSQLKANEIEINNDLADQKAIQSQIERYQSRLNLTPVRAQQLLDLQRNYELSKKNYEDLMAKKTQSELATSLIERRQGERFRIIDQPSLPTKPTSSARIKVSLGGLVAGLALGLALAFFVESRDHSLRNEHDLRRAFAFPLMLGVPLLLNKAEEHRRTRLATLEWVCGILMCVLLGMTEFYVYWRS
jgi:polysaccharide chain length determinant protein (PEP-CTERM system associated)